MTVVDLEELVVRARVGRTSLARAWFEVHLPMTKKNAYGLLFGPADAEGELRVSQADLLGDARRIIDLFPMDYVTLEAASTGECSVRAVNRSAIERLRGAYETWSETGYYAADFLEQMSALDARLAELRPEAQIDVDASMTPPEALELRVEAVRVSEAV